MHSLPDPSYFLHLSESFIKTARLETRGDKPRLCALGEISAAELSTQPNPLIQIALDKTALPIPVLATLSLGDTLFQTHSFERIGFSTLTEFISEGNPQSLKQYELGVFQLMDGKPAPTASPTPLELVFCGFNAKVIPELSDAFPNLDAEAKSITLSALDQICFLKSQCKTGESILLVEICNDRTHLILIGEGGLEAIRSVDLGRQSLYEAMAEVLHLHYIGSAIKLFTRSGFDSSELAPKLGKLFGSAIASVLQTEQWSPTKVHIAGLLSSQDWFLAAVLNDLKLDGFQIDRTLLPFKVDDSVGDVRPMDTEIVAKIYTSLAPNGDFSWHSEFLSSLRKSVIIPRRESSGSNPPFPTAHPERTPPVTVATSDAYRPFADSIPPGDASYAPRETAPAPLPPPVPPSAPVAPLTAPPAAPSPRATEPPARDSLPLQAIPDHLLKDIEEYEGEFEEDDDYGGGSGRVAIKVSLLVLSILIIGVMVTVVFFPKASVKYLGIRPPHVDFEDAGPDTPRASGDQNSGFFGSSNNPSESDVASGLQNLQNERNTQGYGGLFLPTNPSGATVAVGSLSPRLSPIKLPNVEPGDYEVIITKAGYETERMSITIKPKEVLKIDVVNLKPTR